RMRLRRARSEARFSATDCHGVSRKKVHLRAGRDGYPTRTQEIPAELVLGWSHNSAPGVEIVAEPSSPPGVRRVRRDGVFTLGEQTELLDRITGNVVRTERRSELLEPRCHELEERRVVAAEDERRVSDPTGDERARGV